MHNIAKIKEFHFYSSVGKTYIQSEKEKPRIGKVQVCFGLQNKRTASTNGAQGKWDQKNEGANSKGIKRQMIVGFIHW